MKGLVHIMDKESMKLSWSMPQISEINVKMTEDAKPYTGNDGLNGKGEGQAGSKIPSS